MVNMLFHFISYVNNKINTSRYFNCDKLSLNYNYTWLGVNGNVPSCRHFHSVKGAFLKSSLVIIYFLAW